MGLLIKGITKLSELEIDADKVWVDLGAVPHGITSIKEVAQAMARGDLVVRGDTVLIRIQPGADGYVLTSSGLGKIPVWMPAGGSLKYYFPVWIGLTDAEDIVIAAKQDNEPAPFDRLYVVGYIARGTHTAGDSATIMTDALAAFTVDALIGRTIYNKTDGSSGLVTDNDATTITCAGGLIGGGDNTWQLGDAYGDGTNLERFSPTLVSVDAEDIVIAAKTDNEPAPIGRDISIPVEGAVSEKTFDIGTHDAADSFTIMTDSVRTHWVVNALIGKTILNTTDGSAGVITANTEHTATVVALIGGIDQTWQAGDAYIVQTDQTAAAKSAALNDMNLNPCSGDPLGLNDKYYIGASWKFPRMWLNLSTPGIGNWTNTYEYWNGAAWVPVVDEVDMTSSFLSASGWKRIQWTPQVDWALTTILGMNLYWVRSRTSNFANQATKPLGAQVFCCLVT
jgi:hypothetical protein